MVLENSEIGQTMALWATGPCQQSSLFPSPPPKQKRWNVKYSSCVGFRSRKLAYSTNLYINTQGLRIRTVTCTGMEIPSPENIYRCQLTRLVFSVCCWPEASSSAACWTVWPACGIENGWCCSICDTGFDLSTCVIGRATWPVTAKLCRKN